VGRQFTIARAGITDITYFSSGVKYTLTDDTGSIILLLWQNVLEEVPDRRDLYPGSQVRVVGEIDEYGGDLEVIPEEGAHVEVLAPGDRAPVEVRPVGDVTPADEGRLFTIEGVVGRTEDQGWLYIWIGDESGEVLVYVPERVVEFLPAGVGPGVRLRVTGEVDIYKGVLEIIPQAGADVEVR
jgi:DNA/RNA endonuclease YhcR with UshA esterase domain